MSEILEAPLKVFGNSVTEFAREDSRIVVLSADSGESSGFGPFIKEFPERYFEFGIMEQGVIGIAAGMAAAGKIPIFCAITPFVTARPFEMFRNDLGYMGQNVKVIGRNCGISYSDLGSTHFSLDDLGIIKMIPDVVILAPQDPDEIREAVGTMLKHPGPVYMRLGKPDIPRLFPRHDLQIGKGFIIQEGTDIAILSTGTCTAAAMQACELLKECGISPMLIGMPAIHPIDQDLIIKAAQITGRVLTVEEHYRDGGMGSMAADVLSQHCPVPLRKLGLPNEYIATGPYPELLAYYGLDCDGIVRSVKEFLASDLVWNWPILKSVNC